MKKNNEERIERLMKIDPQGKAYQKLTSLATSLIEPFGTEVVLEALEWIRDEIVENCPAANFPGRTPEERRQHYAEKVGGAR